MKKQKKTSMFSAWFKQNILDSQVKLGDFIRSLSDQEIDEIISEIGLGKKYVTTDLSRQGLENRILKILSQKKSAAGTNRGRRANPTKEDDAKL